MPGDEISTFPLLSEYFVRKQVPDLVVVAADLGFAKKWPQFRRILKAPCAFVGKAPRRQRNRVPLGDRRCEGQNVLIVDDEVDRGTTLAGAAHILRDEGAKDIYTCFVHATFSDQAAQLLAGAGFKEIVCTDSEPITPAKQLPNLKVIHLGPWLAKIIESVHLGLSVGKTLQEYRPEFDL
jgi:ribose-phosphate pyrophosphokinase